MLIFFNNEFLAPWFLFWEGEKLVIFISANSKSLIFLLDGKFPFRIVVKLVLGAK